MPESEPVLFPNDEAPANPEPIRLTQSQFQALEGRKRLLMEKAEKVEFLLSGRSRSVLPEMTDEKKLYSEEKTHALVNQLLQYVQFYYRNRRQTELNNKEQTCLRSFFYCALRLSAGRPTWIPEIRGAFQDLLLCAQRIYYPSRTSLYYEELYGFERNNDFFGWMDECYELLTGLSITLRISDVDKQLARETYWKELAELNELLVDSLDPDECENGLNILDQEDWETWELEQLKRSGVPARDICLTAYSKDLTSSYIKQLNSMGVQTYELKNKADDRGLEGIRVSTMHRVKGLEFQYMFIAGMNRDVFPSRTASREKLKQDKCLLYVALTRAQKGAYVCGYGKAQSEFLTELNTAMKAAAERQTTVTRQV